MVTRSVARSPSYQTGREIMLIFLLGTPRQVYRDYHRQKCRHQVSEKELGANQNVTKHVLDPLTACDGRTVCSEAHL